jgi:hypothetical protein
MGVSVMVRPVYPAIFMFGAVLLLTPWSLFEGAVKIKAATKPIDCTLRIDYKILWRNFRTRFLIGLAPALFVAAAISGPYYINNSSRVLSFVDTYRRYAERTPEVLNRFWYLMTLHRDTSIFVLIFILIGVALSVARPKPESTTLLVYICVTLVLLSFSPAKFFYYFAPLYPFLLIMSSFWIYELKRLWFRRAFLCILIFGNLVIMTPVLWGLPVFNNGPIKALLRVRVKFPEQPDQLDWRMAEVAYLIRNNAAISTPKVGFVSPAAIMNSASFRFLSWPIGEGFSYFEPTFPLHVLLLSDCVVVELKETYQPLEPWALGPEILRNRESVFYQKHQMVSTLDLLDGRQVEIYKRLSPASLAEAKAIVSELLTVDPLGAEKWLERELPRIRRLHPSIAGAFMTTSGEAPRGDVVID